MSLRMRTLRVLLSLYFVSFSILIMREPRRLAPPVEAAGLSPAASETTSPAVTGRYPPAIAAQIPSVATDANGAFRFAGLESGTHELYLDPTTLPPNLRPAPGAPQVAMWINPGQSLVSDVIGAGVRFSANYDEAGRTISGVVFVDRDANGQFGEADEGLPGITVFDPALHQYFVPFYDDDLWTLFAEINNHTPPINECLTWASRTSYNLNSFISVTSSSDGTIFYYDHWEDGYDTDPLMPSLSTEVGVIDAGVTQEFNDLVATPRVPSALQYDGRDRITVFGGPASVIRAAYPITLEIPGPTIRLGDVLAGAWEVPQVSDWGQRYVAVIGEDLDGLSLGPDNDFDYVGLEIMAAQSNTQVWRNGTLLATLGTGDTYLIDGANDGPGGGGVDSGDIITATGPIQVQVLGANCSSPAAPTGWSARAYTRFPFRSWDTDYWAPVPDFTENATWCPIDRNPSIQDRDTDIYVHNPQSFPITVNFDDGGPGTPIPLNVPANSTISVLAILNSTYGRDLSDTMGAHLYSTEVFWGVSAVDSISGNSSIDSESNVNDWGYPLIPVALLSSKVIIGWSPGNSLRPPTINPIHNNGNLAFVSALTDTVVYADFTQDGLPDAFDINGDGDADDFDVHFNPNFDEPTSNDGVVLLAGEVLRVADPNDNDLTGAAIYTRDLGHKIAVAWGQDPCSADRIDPYMDLGFTVLPLAIPELIKELETSSIVEADLCGNLDTSQIITYTIVLHNNGIGPLINGVLTDTLPYTYTDYIVGSLAVAQPPSLGSEVYYNGITAAWGYTPVPNANGVDPNVYAFRLTWPRIEGGETVTATFGVRLQADIPPDVDEFSNQAAFSSEGTEELLSQDPLDLFDSDTDTLIVSPEVEVTKTAEPASVRPGDLVTYTVVANNTGNGPARDVVFVDRLPIGVTYQPNTLDLTLPSVVTEIVTATVPYITSFDGSYADDFDLTSTETTNYAGSDGSLAWSTDWTEVNDDGAPGTGDVQVGTVLADSLSPPAYLLLTDNDEASSSVVRTMDLTEFVAPRLTFYVNGVSDAGDTYSVLVNGVPLAGFPETYDGPYQRRVVDLSAFAGQAAVTLEFQALPAMEPDDFYRIDNIVVYEASPLRTGSDTIVVDTTQTITYTTQTGIDPVGLDPVSNIMTVTNPVDIPAGAYVRFSFQVATDSPLPNGEVLINTAVVTSTEVGIQPCLLAADAPLAIQSGHALTITKVDDLDPVFVNELLTYYLTWEVGGDEPAPGVVVTDTLPLPYVSFVSCEPLPACQGETSPGSGVVTWDLGDRLPAGSGITYDSGTLTLTVRVDQRPPGGVFTNTVIIDDATDVPTDEDDEPTQVLEAGYALSKERVTASPVDIGDTVEFLIVITNTGSLTITRLPLEDTYDPVYLQYEDALPAPDTTASGLLIWNDLTSYLPGFGFVLPPSERVQVWVQFTALSSTQQLVPPVTINTAAAEGVLTDIGELPRREDVADVGILDEGGTAIELLYLRAKPKGGGVLVEWATLFEVDTYGFWIYRSADAEMSHAVPVTFVPATGSSGLGASYEYLDTELASGQYHYWLIEEEYGGRRTTYGPVNSSTGWDDADLPYRVYLPLVLR